MDDKTRSTLRAVISTLDTIAVTGRQNMEKLLACMAALDKLITNNAEKGE